VVVSMTQFEERGRRPQVTVVTPVFNEADNLPRYEVAVTGCLLSRSDYNFHILLVDDGSTDSSWSIIKEMSLRTQNIVGVRLSRNYGSHVALSAGFARATGDAVATLACDLQDPPEVILDFLEKWNNGAKIVWGRRRSRQDGFWRRCFSNLFAGLLARFAMPRGSKFSTGSFLLVDRMVVECFNQFQEQNRITFAIVAWTGFDQEMVDYDRKRREAGTSKWSFSRMVKTMYDAFIGFSLLPVRVMTLVGVGISLLSVCFLIYLFFAWTVGHPAPGWTSQMLALSFFFGVQFLLMGVMGEYLYRIYAEVVRRPLYFISEMTGLKQDGSK